jgi:hypothetical protein
MRSGPAPVADGGWWMVDGCLGFFRGETHPRQGLNTLETCRIQRHNRQSLCGSFDAYYQQRYRKNNDQSQCCRHGLHQICIRHDLDQCGAIHRKRFLNGIGDIFGFGYPLAVPAT